MKGSRDLQRKKPEVFRRNPVGLQQEGTVTRLAVKAVPNASSDEICGWLGETLKVRVASPAEAGKANQRILELLADRFGLPQSHVRIVSGAASPRKTVEIVGLCLEEIRTLLPSQER